MRLPYAEELLASYRWYEDRSEYTNYVANFAGDYSLAIRSEAALGGIVVAMYLRGFEQEPDAPITKLLTEQQPPSVLPRFTEQVHEFARTVHTTACVAAAFIHGGKHVYEVSAGLLERLKFTSTDDLTDEDLTLPYPMTWFEFPKGSIRTNIGFTDEPLDVVGCMIRSVVRPEPALEVTLIGQNIFVDGDNTQFYLNSTILPHRVKFNLEHEVRIDERRTGKHLQAYKAFWGSFWDLLVNLLMYATHPDAAAVTDEAWNPAYIEAKKRVKRLPHGSKKLERAKAQLKTIAPMHRIILGRNVEPLPTLPPQTKGAPLTVRTLVQGHWMRFATGKGRVDRTWKFRSPFWRGPTDAPQSNARHVMV